MGSHPDPGNPHLHGPAPWCANTWNDTHERHSPSGSIPLVIGRRCVCPVVCGRAQSSSQASADRSRRARRRHQRHDTTRHSRDPPRGSRPSSSESLVASVWLRVPMTATLHSGGTAPGSHRVPAPRVAGSHRSGRSGHGKQQCHGVVIGGHASRLPRVSDERCAVSAAGHPVLDVAASPLLWSDHRPDGPAAVGTSEYWSHP